MQKPLFICFTSLVPIPQISIFHSRIRGRRSYRTGTAARDSYTDHSIRRQVALLRSFLIVLYFALCGQQDGIPRQCGWQATARCRRENKIFGGRVARWWDLEKIIFWLDLFDVSTVNRLCWLSPSVDNASLSEHCNSRGVWSCVQLQ